MKKNKKGFFLAETMVVIAVVAVVLLGVFKLFSSVYERFNETEKYNTVNAINALSNIQMYYENIEDIDVSEISDDDSYIELTNNEKYSSEYYTKLKEELNVKSVLMIDLNKYFSNPISNTFNVSLRRYINTLKNINGVVIVIALNNNEYASVELSNKIEIKLNGNQEDEYAVYVPLGGEFIDPGYVGWNGDEPEITWENGIEIDTSKEGNYYLHYDFNGYILRRKIVVVDSNGVAYITKLLSHEESIKNGLAQTQVTYNGTNYDTGIRYVGSVDDVSNKIYYNCEDTDENGIGYGAENYEYNSSCEVWRIIGIFNTKTSESDMPVKRIKIINTASTFKSSWDSSISTINDGNGINQWGESGDYAGADLMNFLNGYYIGKEGTSCKYCSGNNQEVCSQTCTIESLKELNLKPLTNTAKDFLESIIWDTYAVYNNGSAVTSSNAGNVYLEEKGISYQYTGNSKCKGLGNSSCNDEVTRTTSWKGLVGLMSLSDVGYANGWLNNPIGITLSPWTISVRASSGSACYAWVSADYKDDRTDVKSGVWPTAYLKSDVEIIGGDGKTMPYILK